MGRADSVHVQVEVKEEKVEVLERKQSTITFGELPQRDDIGVKDGGERVGEKKEQTFSKEMYDAIGHALYRDEDGMSRRCK